MEFRFLDLAQAEFDEAVVYYNSELPGLGDDFLVQVLKALDRIKQFPKAWHPYTKNTRRCLVRRFPYGVVYQILKDEILIVAIQNLHRRPDYWHDRI